MCRALYIASDKPLPLIEWHEDTPAFCILKLQEQEESVRKQFQLPFVAYAGSFEGCSCGFVYDEEPIEDDDYEKQYDAEARDSVKMLSDYVFEILSHGGRVEMFTCWQGEQDHQPDEQVLIGKEFFERSEFGFEGIKHYKVIG